MDLTIGDEFKPAFRRYADGHKLLDECYKEACEKLNTSAHTLLAFWTN